MACRPRPGCRFPRSPSTIPGCVVLGCSPSSPSSSSSRRGAWRRRSTDRPTRCSTASARRASDRSSPAEIFAEPRTVPDAFGRPGMGAYQRVPVGLDAHAVCWGFDPTKSAACEKGLSGGPMAEVSTSAGRYNPLFYLVVGPAAVDAQLGRPGRRAPAQRRHVRRADRLGVPGAAPLVPLRPAGLRPAVRRHPDARPPGRRREPERPGDRGRHRVLRRRHPAVPRATRPVETTAGHAAGDLLGAAADPALGRPCLVRVRAARPGRAAALGLAEGVVAGYPGQLWVRRRRGRRAAVRDLDRRDAHR